MVPMKERDVLICTKCVLECIWSHPKMIHFQEERP